MLFGTIPGASSKQLPAADLQPVRTDRDLQAHFRPVCLGADRDGVLGKSLFQVFDEDGTQSAHDEVQGDCLILQEWRIPERRFRNHSAPVSLQR